MLRKTPVFVLSILILGFSFDASCPQASAQSAQPPAAKISLGEGAMRPQLAANRTGSAVVVWHAKSGDKAHVYSKVLDRSKQWGRTVDLNMGKSAFIKSTEVAMDGNGNGVAVWSAGNGKSKGATSVQEVWCARFTAGDGWSRPSQLGSAQRRLAQRSTGCRDQ